MPEPEYRYLTYGKVKHEMSEPGLYGGSNSSLCGIICIPASNWMGKGSWQESETLKELPICGNCKRRKRL